MIGMKYADRVRHGDSQSTADEIEQLVAGVRAFGYAQHKEDGSHTDITADSVRAPVASFEELEAENATIGGDIAAAIFRLTPHNTFTRTQTNEENTLRTVVSQSVDPEESLWFLENPSGLTWNIVGIFTQRLFDADYENDGRLLVLINNSATKITFSSTLVTDERRLYGCTPSVVLPPGGVIRFVYDGENLGWRLDGFSREQHLSLWDTDLSHALSIVGGSNLSAARQLTLTTGDADRVLTISGDASIDQDTRTTGTPSFASVKATGGALASANAGVTLASLATGRLLSGGGAGTVQALHTFFDSYAQELTAGSSAGGGGFVAGVTVAARSYLGTGGEGVAFWTRNTERGRFDGAGLLTLTAGLATSALTVNGFAVTVSAAAAIDQDTRTSGSPSFAGITINGFGLTVSAASAIDQDVRTSAHPLFNILSVSLGIDAGGEIESAIGFIVNGTAGINSGGSVTLAKDGGGTLTIAAVGGILTVWTEA